VSTPATRRALTESRVLSIPVILAALAQATGSAAADPQLTLKATPPSVEVCSSGVAAPALIVLTNSGNGAVSHVCVTTLANPPIVAELSAWPTGSAAGTEACPGGIFLTNLPPGGSYSGRLSLRSEKGRPRKSVVIVRAEYKIGDAPGATAQTAATTVEASPESTDSEALKVEPRAGFASLHEKAEGALVLLVTNGTADTLQLSDPIPTAPRSTTVQLVGQRPSVIAPKSTVAIAYKVQADENIDPGKHSGSFEVHAQTACGTEIHRVGTYEVTLGVFGESTLLTAIGVPSLLLLPGFLIVTLCMLVWRFRPIRVSFLGGETFIVTAREPEFWLLAVGISLGLFVLAPHSVHVGYDRPYSLPDIARMWGFSLCVGLGAYIVLFVVDRALHLRANAARIARTLTPNDDVVTAIERLRLRGWQKDQCRPVKITAKKLRGFVLWEEKTGESAWVIPQIRCVTATGAAPDGYDPAVAEIEDLARQLREIESKKLARVRWGHEASGFGIPTVMRLSDLEEDAGELVVVTSG
jgi:hypothetical protein